MAKAKPPTGSKRKPKKLASRSKPPSKKPPKRAVKSKLWLPAKTWLQFVQSNSPFFTALIVLGAGSLPPSMTLNKVVQVALGKIAKSAFATSVGKDNNGRPFVLVAFADAVDFANAQTAFKGKTVAKPPHGAAASFSAWFP